MKKTTIIFIITLFVTTTAIHAQACKFGRKIGQTIIKVLEKEKIDIKKVSSVKRKAIIEKNWKEITKESDSKRGIRALYLDDKKVSGVITDDTQRTYVMPPVKVNTIAIGLKAIKGKATADIFICQHSKDGTSEQLEQGTLSFSKYETKPKKIVLKDVKGKIISIAILGSKKDEGLSFEIDAIKLRKFSFKV